MREKWERKKNNSNWTELKWNETKRSFRSKCQKNAWINKTNGAYFVQFYCCILLINKWIRVIVSEKERNVASLQLSNAQFNGIRHIFFSLLLFLFSFFISFLLHFILRFLLHCVGFHFFFLFLVVFGFFFLVFKVIRNVNLPNTTIRFGVFSNYFAYQNQQDRINAHTLCSLSLSISLSLSLTVRCYRKRHKSEWFNIWI